MEPRKTVKSALAIIPPPEIWEGFQKIRSVHDKAYKRWPPHINLLYPFLPEDSIAGYIPAIMRELSAVSPFKVTFGQEGFGRFEHARSATVWVCPSPAQKIVSLEERLVRAVPQCRDLLDFDEAGFKPHLTLGQASKSSTRCKYASSWAPVSCVIDSLYIITRDGDEPFTVSWVLPLGKGDGRRPIRNMDRSLSVYDFLTTQEYASSGEEEEVEEIEEEEKEVEESIPRVKDDKKKSSKSGSGGSSDDDDDSNGKGRKKIVVRKKVDVISEELKSKKKPKLRTSTDVFNRILWDKDLKPEEFTITYKDRFDGMMEVPFLEFPTEDVPFHRIWLFKKNGQVVWDRAARIDCVFKTK